MSWLGATEAAARIPSLLATAFTVLLTFSLGRKLYGNGVGVLAAWLVALSPFTLLFAPTAFTDPLLVTLVIAACLAAASGRAGWAGIGMGLAIATKQQGVFFVPLVISLLVIGLIALRDKKQVAGGRWQVADSNFHVSRFRAEPPFGTPHIPYLTSHISHLLLALLFTLLPIFLWNLNRSQTPDFLIQSLANYGGLVTDAASFGERWEGFIELLYYGTASPVLNAILVVGLPALLIYGLWGCRANATGDRRPKTGNNFQPFNLSTFQPSSPSTFQPSTLPALQPSNLPTFQPSTDWLLFLFILVFLLGHALLSFQVWDRYLLGLIPLLALLLARILLLPWSFLKNLWLDTRPDGLPLAGAIYGLALTGLLALTLARPVQDAVNGRYALGSHSQALQGIEQIVAYLQGHAGDNHTLYHRWLGTHWRFYLWGYPYDLQYWASPQELAAKAKPGHLIAFPSWRSDTEARLALADVGLALKELTRAYHPAGYPSMVLYEIVSSDHAP
jgi:hypothetical protein